MDIRKPMLGLGLCLALTACGQRSDLVRSAGERGPAIPTGERVAPNFADQTTPTIQARPERSDEVLRQSEERKADPFDLPPG